MKNFVKRKRKITNLPNNDEQFLVPSQPLKYSMLKTTSKTSMKSPILSNNNIAVQNLSILYSQFISNFPRKTYSKSRKFRGNLSSQKSERESFLNITNGISKIYNRHPDCLSKQSKRNRLDFGSYEKSRDKKSIHIKKLQSWKNKTQNLHNSNINEESKFESNIDQYESYEKFKSNYPTENVKLFRINKYYKKTHLPAVEICKKIINEDICIHNEEYKGNYNSGAISFRDRCFVDNLPLSSESTNQLKQNNKEKVTKLKNEKKLRPYRLLMDTLKPMFFFNVKDESDETNLTTPSFGALHSKNDKSNSQGKLKSEEKRKDNKKILFGNLNKIGINKLYK